MKFLSSYREQPSERDSDQSFTSVPVGICQFGVIAAGLATSSGRIGAPHSFQLCKLYAT
jgi:hypothetical protein